MHNVWLGSRQGGRVLGTEEEASQPIELMEIVPNATLVIRMDSTLPWTNSQSNQFF